MSVYVDSEYIPYGRMLMCHMVADTTEELIAMADQIGVRRRHIQSAGTAQEHFDVCKAMRDQAVRRGAIEIDRRGLVNLIRQKRAAMTQQSEQP